MFTGIIQSVGQVAALEAGGGDVRLVVATPPDFDLAGVAIGDSVAVAGVCLTVVARDAASFSADVSTETLALTTLGGLAVGAEVNLEQALRLSDRLGGHLVSGHVDGVGRVVSSAPDARAQRWVFRAPGGLMRYLAVKGSVAVDGVSLTVNEVGHETFGVALIPHTIAATTFRGRAPGDGVNLEVDVVARYVERLRAHDASAAGAGRGCLARAGSASQPRSGPEGRAPGRRE